MKLLLEYIWLDGYDTLRSKTKVMSVESDDYSVNPSSLPS